MNELNRMWCDIQKYGEYMEDKEKKRINYCQKTIFFSKKIRNNRF